MKVPLDWRQSNDGFYGGFGSKPARRPWMPTVHKEPAPAPKRRKVPRRLRLRRTRPARMEPDPGFEKCTAVLAALPMVLLLAVLLLGILVAAFEALF